MLSEEIRNPFIDQSKLDRELSIIIFLIDLFSLVSFSYQDKIASFWEISKKELEDRRAELRNKDREMEEMEERHAVEIKVYKQKVKHLLYEHQNNVAALKADGEAALKLAGDAAQKRENDMM